MDDTDDLIASLCTRAATLMEDAVPDALRIQRVRGKTRAAVLARLGTSAAHATTLLEAAVALADLGSDAE